MGKYLFRTGAVQPGEFLVLHPQEIPADPRGPAPGERSKCCRDGFGHRPRAQRTLLRRRSAARGSEKAQLNLVGSAPERCGSCLAGEIGCTDLEYRLSPGAGRL